MSPVNDTPQGAFFINARMGSHKTVFNHADAVNLDAHDVAPLSGTAAASCHADTGRRAGRNHVAGVERDAARTGLDQCLVCQPVQFQPNSTNSQPKLTRKTKNSG
jgi:hypothetical protein